MSKHRGFKSNRKTDKPEDDTGLIKSASLALRQKLRTEGHPTYGAYLWARLQAGQGVRVRAKGENADKHYDFYPTRDMLLDEFDVIWAEQSSHHTLSDEFRDRLRDTTMSWPDTLTIVREFGTRSAQSTYKFRFEPTEEAKNKLQTFSLQLQAIKKFNKNEGALRSAEDIQAELIDLGFTRRTLKDFQLRDLAQLLHLPNGANFSVPGAGKTTVTFALKTRRVAFNRGCAQSGFSSLERHRWGMYRCRSEFRYR